MRVSALSDQGWVKDRVTGGCGRTGVVIVRRRWEVLED